MQKSLRLVGAAALIGLGVWGWFIFFPSPEKVIRSRLNQLAGTLSFEPKDGIIARGYRADKAARFFTPDVEVSVDVRGMEPMVFSGREEIQQRALGGARLLRGLKVEFLDINVTLGPDKQTATANLTAKWTISGDREFNVQEFNFHFKKVGGEWLIYRVETVKTLSQLILRAA
jgi:hypothetical protein